MFAHVSVLVREAIDFLRPAPAGGMSTAHWAVAVTAKRFSPRAVLMAKCWGWIETMKRLPRRANA